VQFGWLSIFLEVMTTLTFRVEKASSRFFETSLADTPPLHRKPQHKQHLLEVFYEALHSRVCAVVRQVKLKRNVLLMLLERSS
jgi:hypothetical protein